MIAKRSTQHYIHINVFMAKKIVVQYSWGIYVRCLLVVYIHVGVVNINLFKTCNMKLH